MNVNENNCQPEVKKSNSKAAATTPVSEPVRAPASTCVLEQAAVANQVTERIADQKVHSFTHQELFTMVPGLKRTFTQKTEAADGFMAMQFLGTSIGTAVGLPAHLYVTSCSRITAKVNGHLVQTFLDAGSEINMMNYKIAEICGIPIHCEVTLEMQTADSEKAPFYSCAEDVEVKIAGIISTLSIFVTEGVENELILEHLWEQVVEANTFSQADGSVEWTIHNFKKKVMFLDCFSKTTPLHTEKDVFSATLN